MSDEMLQSHIRRRVREGAAHDQIRAELAGMGMDMATAEKLLAPPKKDDWEDFLFWMQLSPLVIVPMVALVMAAIFPKPKLAVMLVALGIAVYFVAWMSMIANAGREKGFFWVVMMVFTGGFGMFAYFLWHMQKIWKQFLVYMMGVAVSICGVLLDPEAIREAFPENFRHERRRRGELPPHWQRDLCLLQALSEPVTPRAERTAAGSLPAECSTAAPANAARDTPAQSNTAAG